MYRTLLAILSVFAAALLLARLTFSTTVDDPAEFRFANGTEPKTLDPHLMTGQPEGRVASELFEGLTRRDAKTMRPSPGVAERWELSEDGLRYTFHLRANARWTDGSPLTAEDFVYSWKRVLSPTLGSEYAYIMFPVRLAEAYSTYAARAVNVRKTIRPALDAFVQERPADAPASAFKAFLVKNQVEDAVRGIASERLIALLHPTGNSVNRDALREFAGELDVAAHQLEAGAAEAARRFGVDAGVFARDPRTLIVELRAPTPYFLEVTSFYPSYPVPRKLVENPKYRDTWFLPETIVSNGAFRLARWSVNDRIRLEKNPHYWGKDEVKLNSLDALPVENETTCLNLYLTGAIDWLPGYYPKDLIDVLKQRPDYYAEPGLAVYYYRLNNTKPPLNDPRVRKALNLAIDRRVVVEKVLGMGQLPATTFVPPGLSGYEPPPSSIRLDVPAAKQLLADAGFPDGKGFPTLGILYNTNDTHKKVADFIADQLRKNLQIDVNPYNQEWQAYLDSQRLFNYEMSRAAWVGDYADPNTFLDMWVTNGPNNQTGYGNPLYDDLVRLASDVTPLLREPERVLARIERPDALRAAVERAKQAKNPAEAAREREALRMSIFREAEAILLGDELPIIPIYFYVNTGFIRPGVSGFYTKLEQPDGTTSVNLQDLHPLRDIAVTPQH
jgi:oligopeptide transport system substrate-binding protein